MRVNAGRGDRVLINVIDEGPGVARETPINCSNRSSDLVTGTTNSLWASGLSVARGFTEAMGGTISATDTPRWRSDRCGRSRRANRIRKP